MLIIKSIILFVIFVIFTVIGTLISKKYVKREEQLKEIKTALNMFKSKVKFTYEPVGEIFKEISYKYEGVTSNLFKLASENMRKHSAGEAWSKAIDLTYTELTKEDKNVLKSLSKTLGKTTAEGQICEIELTDNFLDLQIEDARSERTKNEKLYRTLGIISGLGFVIILL